MRTFILITSLLLPTLCHGQKTSEKPTPAKVERAWENEDYGLTKPLNGAPYLYGIHYLHDDVANSFLGLNDEEKNENSDDPFAGNGAEGYKKEKGIKPDKLPPLIPAAQNPLCLPEGRYFNMRPFLVKQGIKLKGDEWALGRVIGDGMALYYCTKRINSDVLEMMMAPRCCIVPYLFDYRTTLVSIEDKSLTDKAWTMARLRNSKPKVVMRTGLVCRSGEIAKTVIKSKKTSPATSLEIIANRGDDAVIYSLGMEFKWSDPKLGIKLMQSTQLDGRIGHPNIIDCGTHGKNPRRYLLISHLNEKNFPLAHPHGPLEPVQKIEGIYAMRNGHTPQKNATNPLFTVRFQTQLGFLSYLRHAEYHASRNDAFGNDDHVLSLLPAPPRVTQYPASKDLPAGDLIYDITAHFKKTGVTIRPKEWVYYNKTKRQLIAHGLFSMGARSEYWMENNLTILRGIRTSFRIVEVDINSIEHVPWTLEEIAKRNPKRILHHATQSRSGEIGNSGLLTTTSSKDEKGKTTYQQKGELNYLANIRDDDRYIDMSYSLKNKKPLGDKNLHFQSISTAPVHDGEPLIIELGHPSRSDRVHLLIITGNLVLPDGRFFRNRYQLIQ